MVVFGELTTGNLSGKDISLFCPSLLLFTATETDGMAPSFSLVAELFEIVRIR